jgi:hypothetical protein
LNAKTQRYAMFILVPVILLLAVGSALLGLPDWVAPMLVLLVLGGFVAWFLHRAANRPFALDTQPAPADLERLKVACLAAGRPDLEPGVISQQESDHFRTSDGRLSMSHRLLDGLSDMELQALIAGSVGPAGIRIRRMTRRYHAVWIGGIALAFVSFPWNPLAFFLGFVIAVAYGVTSQSWPAQRWFARKETGVLRQEGVNLAGVVLGRAKLYSHLFISARVTAANAFPLRHSLEFLAAEAGISAEAVEEAIAAPMREFSLRWPTEKPPSQWKPLFRKLAIWLIIVVVSVAVAMQLGNH